MNTDFIPEAYCGLYCAACPVYQATKKGNTNISPEAFICHGCKSQSVKKGWCSICNLKACAREKGLEFCYECPDYPCKDLETFKTDRNYPYHSEIYDYLETIKIKGKEAWLDKMSKRWSCPQCQTVFHWWNTECPECKAKVRGYINPGE